MTNFVKRVLIEQAELERLQQRQLRDYSPELHSMSLLNNQINDIINKINITAEEKLNLLSTVQAIFDKLKKTLKFFHPEGSRVHPHLQWIHKKLLLLMRTRTTTMINMTKIFSHLQYHQLRKRSEN